MFREFKIQQPFEFSGLKITKIAVSPSTFMFMPEDCIIPSREILMALTTRTKSVFPLLILNSDEN